MVCSVNRESGVASTDMMIFLGFLGFFG